MKRLALFVPFLAASLMPVAAQSPAFVPQLAGGSGAAVGQAQSQQGGAFVQQLPADARPRNLRSAPAAPNYVAANFIAVRTVTDEGEEPLVVNEDAGITGYGQEKRPRLPTIGSGASVIVTPPNVVRNLPDIGMGAVLL